MVLVSGAASSDLTGAKCNANTIHWAYDTWNLANGTGKAMVKTGGDTWFFLTADYAFGQALERDTVRGGRGEWRQGARQGAGADQHQRLLVVPAAGAGVAGQGDRPRQCRRRHHQLHQAGGRVRHRQRAARRLAGLLVFASDIAALGLPTAQGLVLTETWYWDMNDANRAWTKRWQAERPGKIPTMVHAGVYSSVMHYLKAVEALKADGDGKAVVAKMKEMPTDDPLFGKGVVRADGRKIHDAYLFEVKKPAESKYPGDFYKTRATIPAAEAFRPLKDGGCPLVQG